MQDKFTQKQTLNRAGLPTAEYTAVATVADVKAFGAQHGYPLVLKTRTFGYDGYGNAQINRESDIQAAFDKLAATGRIGSLLWGSKGRMLNNRRSIPMETLMTQPTMLELESLNDDEKALVMLFLLTMIREYCRVNRHESKLQHVTLIEEAHRVMACVPHASDRETSADTRAQAVEMFSASLSEVRAFGEGLIIAEQIPGRLAEDALKNTSIKIVHRLPGQDDRQAVGATMNLSHEQESFLTKLSPGQAALFIEGYERPAFISVPDYRGQHKLPERVSDEAVIAHMASFKQTYARLELPFDGCRFCLRQCRYRDRVGPVAYEIESGKRFREAWRELLLRRQKGEAAGWTILAKACQASVEPIGLGADAHAAYCLFVHLWTHEFTEAMADGFRQAISGG
ncbi:MAG: ATP-grasp domain-containing protein [Blastocatellia bacterium]|nr:ATP-grasp domain-containing protein [Blastocatellia bacterium]